MNTADIKETFYKRYETSDNFLHYIFTGTLCSLLGHSEIQGAPFLTCSLSMGVGMLARRLDGNEIKIQSESSDRRFSYIPPSPPKIFQGREREIAELLTSLKKYNTGGAEILYKSTIPEFLPKDTEFNLSLVKSLFEAASLDYTAHEAAAVAAYNQHIAPYLAAAYSKSGYCTLLTNDMPENYPLPMTGYKIVSVYCVKKDHERSDKIYSALDTVKENFKDVNSITDVTLSHAYFAERQLRDKKAARFIRHLAEENMRISAAVRGLKKCDIKSLFRAMNASQSSMERYWDLGHEQSFLAGCAKNLEGVMSVRCDKTGIVMIIENDMIDYAVNMIRNDFESNMGYQPTFCVSETI